jgi:hypothetical protein
MPPFTNASIVLTGNSQWSVAMQASNGVTGDQIIGSVCFTPQATQSTFAPLLLSNVVITNVSGTIPGSATSPSRAVIIANQSLLQAQISTNQQRQVTLFGKADTNYVFDYSTNLRTGWSPGWTNAMPPPMFLTTPVQVAASNAPALFLRAREK